MVAFLCSPARTRLRVCGDNQRAGPVHETLKTLPFKIAYESYVNDNSDLWVMNADGSNPVNLTRTPKEQEHYPQISPDGTKMCFVSDVGEGHDAVRSVYVMDIDGKNRKKVAEYRREPFWIKLI